MKNKRSFTSLIMIGVLTALTTTVYSASNIHSSDPNSIVGTWETTVTPPKGSPGYPFQAMLTFFADGNLIETSDGNPTAAASGHGVWTGSGSNYWLSFILFIFDGIGNNTGKVKTYLAIKMVDPNHFTCTVSADLIDLGGKVTRKPSSSTCEGTRLEVQPP
jgi:hypothetical protein